MCVCCLCSLCGADVCSWIRDAIAIGQLPLLLFLVWEPKIHFSKIHSPPTANTQNIRKQNKKRWIRVKSFFLFEMAFHATRKHAKHEHCICVGYILDLCVLLLHSHVVNRKTLNIVKDYQLLGIH